MPLSSSRSDDIILAYYEKKAAAIHTSVPSHCDLILSNPASFQSPTKSTIPQPSVVTVSASKKKYARLDAFQSNTKRKLEDNRIQGKRKKRVTFEEEVVVVEKMQFNTESMEDIRNADKFVV
ncbi:hypothetical protein TrST_g11632 [Triparma strigata]|uniref:Uncharacterized protein n=1 Tax=Triparma strigata TaxID=1606541 RepID=A0A9W7BC53_9STRA|nr:hypothetical protein TrST_g11632 [Triparma strigata]